MFERWTGKPAMVTICSDGVCTFNSAAKKLVADWARCDLCYDFDENGITIAFMKKDDGDRKISRGVSVKINLLLEFIGYDSNVKRSFELSRLDQDGNQYVTFHIENDKITERQSLE